MPPQNIYECLRCITLLQLYSTATPIEMVKNRYEVTRFSLLYTNGVMCTAIIALICSIACKMQYSNYGEEFGDLDMLALFVGSLEILISILSCIVSNTSLQINKYTHIDLIDSIHRLDTTLIKEFHVKMNYDKMYRKNMIIVVGFTLYFLVILVILVTNIIKNDLLFAPIILFSYGFVYIPPASTTYVAMNMADLVRIRFRLIQKLLDPDYLKKNFKRGSVRARKLQLLVHKYQDIFAIVKQINEVFGVSLLIIYFHDFTMTTSQLYFVYWKVTDGKEHVKLLLLFALWMLPIIWKTTCLPLYMHLAIRESELCKGPFMRLHDHYPDCRIRNIIEVFMLWNCHNKTKISVAGLFTADLSTGLMFTSAVAMHLLVLIQFKMQEEELTIDN